MGVRVMQMDLDLILRRDPGRYPIRPLPAADRRYGCELHAHFVQLHHRIHYIVFAVDIHTEPNVIQIKIYSSPFWKLTVKMPPQDDVPIQC